MLRASGVPIRHRRRPSQTYLTYDLSIVPDLLDAKGDLVAIDSQCVGNIASRGETVG